MPELSLGQRDEDVVPIIYLLHTEPDDNGTILITCPAFREVTTCAETEDDVERVACDAIGEAIAARLDDLARFR